MVRPRFTTLPSAASLAFHTEALIFCEGGAVGKGHSSVSDVAKDSAVQCSPQVRVLGTGFEFDGGLSLAGCNEGKTKETGHRRLGNISPHHGLQVVCKPAGWFRLLPPMAGHDLSLHAAFNPERSWPRFPSQGMPTPRSPYSLSATISSA
jgi:hypothetical protein